MCVMSSAWPTLEPTTFLRLLSSALLTTVKWSLTSLLGTAPTALSALCAYIQRITHILIGLFTHRLVCETWSVTCISTLCHTSFLADLPCTYSASRFIWRNILRTWYCRVLHLRVYSSRKRRLGTPNVLLRLVMVLFLVREPHTLACGFLGIKNSP